MWDNMIMNQLIIDFNETGDIKTQNIIIEGLYDLSWKIMYHKKPNTLLLWEDMVQNSVSLASRKLHLYNVDKGQSYSYFYRVLYISFLYDMRSFNKKNNGIDKIHDNIKYNEIQHIDVSDIFIRAHEVINNHFVFHNQRANDALDKLEEDVLNNDVVVQNIDQSLRKILKKNRGYIRWNK